jgi:phytoene desaturase
LYCLFPVTNDAGTIDWERETPRMRQLGLRQLEKIGLTDIERRIRFEKIISPAQWQSDYQLYRGATFNLAHNLGQMLHRRPHNRFEDLRNVYLVGGGTHPGSGLPVIFESARISSRLLLDDNRVPFHWPGQTGEAAKYATRGKPAGAPLREEVEVALR